MSLYQLPKFGLPKLKAPAKLSGFWQNRIFLFFLVVFIAFVFGGIGGLMTGSYFYSEIRDYLSKFKIEMPEPQVVEKEIIREYQPQTTEEEKIIQVVESVSPAVVSIVVTKDVEEYYFTPFGETPLQKRIEKKEIGGGTGFIVSEEGMILTNKHVVLDEEADYTVLTNDGKKYPAKVLARDSFRDLAIIEIEDKEKFPTLKLGDSDKLQIGQTVIAIGNALGEFRNTVSVGVISGLERTVTAGGGGISETMEDIIQTDAAINAGNSGGPLFNLKGEVIGINFAMAQEAENIGFAIPVNSAKKDIEQINTLGKIAYPFLGVRYVLINETIQKENNLSVNYGVLVQKGSQGEAAVSSGSAAQKAGLKEGDIILEFNNEKITTENTLAKIIMKYNPGDKVVLKILREGKEILVEVILDERSE